MSDFPYPSAKSFDNGASENDRTTSIVHGCKQGGISDCYRNLKLRRLRSAAVLCFAALAMASSGSRSFASSVELLDVSGAYGERVSMPVVISVDEPVTAVYLRVEYDTNLLVEPAVEPGPLMTSSHTVAHFSPGAGRLNAVVYSPAGSAAFPAGSEAVVYLTFTIDPNANPGESAQVVFTTDTSGTPAFAASGLSNPSGQSVPHTQRNGTVFFKSAATQWLLYE